MKIRGDTRAGGIVLDKQALLNEINAKKRELQERKSEKEELEEKIDALDTFAAECSKHVASFEQSISARRTRLGSIGSLLGSVKAALGYSQRMGEALNGQDYTNTTASISALQGSVSEQRRLVSQDLLDVESEIKTLKNRIRELEYEYAHYSEEDTDDGQ